MRTRTSHAESIFLPQSIECPGAKVFKAGEELVVGKNRIVSTDPQFSEIVRNVTEKNIPSMLVLSRTLARDVSTKKLCNTVGRKGAIRLTHLARLLNTQEESFGAVVLVKNTLWAVFAYWRPVYGDWYVNVHSVAFLHGWFAGCQVLSRVSFRS